MSRYEYSKSGLFLMELLINLLLFCILCGCGLMFFVKSNNMTKDTTTLHNAVRITTSLASIYESGDGSLTPLFEEYTDSLLNDDTLYIYYDEKYQPCERDTSVYHVFIRKVDAAFSKISIEFYDEKGNMAYSISTCNYTPSTPNKITEVTLP